MLISSTVFYSTKAKRQLSSDWLTLVSKRFEEWVSGVSVPAVRAVTTILGISILCENQE